MPTPATGGTKYWFNGLPLDGLERTGYDTGTAKYWFNGLPYDTLASTAPGGITATVNVTQDNNTVTATGTVRIAATANLTQDNNTLVATATVVTPVPTTQAQVYVDIRTTIRSFTIRKRMF